MTIYRLPTRANRTYKGKYPNNVHNVSLGGRDIDGKKCAHFESNDGQRYTVSYDCLDIPARNETRSMTGLPWQLFVHGNDRPTDMSQAEYDTWLGSIRHSRLAQKEQLT